MALLTGEPELQVSPFLNLETIIAVAEAQRSLLQMKQIPSRSGHL